MEGKGKYIYREEAMPAKFEIIYLSIMTTSPLSRS